MTLDIRLHEPTHTEPVDDRVPKPDWPYWLIPKSRHEEANEIVELDGGAVRLPHLGTGRLKEYWRIMVRDPSRGGLQPVPSRIATAASHLALGQARAAFAIADLCVTGRASFAQLGARSVGGRIDWRRVRQLAESAPLLPGVVRWRAERRSPPLPAASASDLDKVIDRMRGVHAHLKKGKRDRSSLPDNPFIAVSGEDDLPLRPVNVYATAYPQDDMELTVWGLHLSLRYAVAGDITSRSKNVLLLHGHSSRLEEVEHVMSALVAKGYTVIALDLPTNGYSAQLDHVDVLHVERPRREHVKLPFDDEAQDPRNHSSHYTLRFLQECVHRFVEELFARANTRPRIDLLAGGSLGGNLGLLFSERAPFGNPGRHPYVDARLGWVGKIAVWSPACLWRDKGSIVAGVPHGRSMQDESDPDLRRDSFNRWMNVDHIFPVAIRQPEQWYRRGWPGKARAIAHSWLGRHETYSPYFRRWHWIVAHDQVKFSHQDKVIGLDGREVDKRHYQLLGGHLLAMCGDGDDLDNTNLFSRVMELAPRSKVPMALQRMRKDGDWEIDGGSIRGAVGHVLMWAKTGHSIHDERPNELAAVLDQFVKDRL